MAQPQAQPLSIPVSSVTVRYYGPPGGKTSWYYWVQALYAGGYSNLSPVAIVNMSQPSLNRDMFNVVSWNGVVGAIGYKVWRTPTSTPPTTGPYMLAQVDAACGSVTDNGYNWQISTDTVVVGVDVNGDANITGTYYVNGVPVGGGGGGSQTPWTSNIDGGGFSLNNAGNVNITGTYQINGAPLSTANIPVPGANNQVIFNNNGAWGTDPGFLWVPGQGLIYMTQTTTQTVYAGLYLVNTSPTQQAGFALQNDMADGGFFLLRGSQSGTGPAYHRALHFQNSTTVPRFILDFDTANTVFCIQNNGSSVSVGINTLTPNSELDVEGTLTIGNSGQIYTIARNTSNALLVFTGYQGGGGNGFIFDLTLPNATVSPAIETWCYGNTTAVALAPVAGNVGIGLGNLVEPSHLLHLAADDAAKPGTNTWTIASDIRLKQDVRPFTEGLSTLTKVQPIRYRYNGQGGLPEIEGVGIDARAHKDVIPDCISTFRGKLNEEETDLYASNSHALTFMLINAVRELWERLEKLETALKKVS